MRLPLERRFRRIHAATGGLLATACLLIQLTALCDPVRATETARLSVESNFAALASEMRARKLPLMLLVSQTHCYYCERLKDELLNPMLISGEYKAKVIMREVVYDDDDDVIGFDGRSQTASAFSRRYKAYVSPTLLFLDADGAELAARIVGYQTPDFFPYEVDQAIEKSRSLFLQAASGVPPKAGPPKNH